MSWRDLTQIDSRRRVEVRRYAEANLDHADDRGLLAAALLLALDLIDSDEHERLVMHTSTTAMWRNRPDFTDPGHAHSHCHLCRCAVQVRFLNTETCPDDS